MKKLFLLVLLITTSYCTLGQSGNIREQVYLHLNSHELISGQTLYFSAYCLSDLNGKPSRLSKILYVEIVGENGVIHQDKIFLKEGRGQGDFFISSLISTGKYQVIAYTQWMKNFNGLYQVPLVIINPYEKYEPKEDTSEATIRMKFFQPGNNIIANIENTVAYKITAPAEMNSPGFRGKVINDDGETILDFQPDAFGLGQFSFIPETGQDYRVILEDEKGKLYFFEMPSVSDSGTTIVLNETDRFIDADVQTYPNKTKKYGRLEVRTAYDALLSKNIDLNSASRIEKPLGINDLIYFDAYDENQNLLCSRVVFVGGRELVQDQLADSFSKREQVHLRYTLAPGNYSVSVRKKPKMLKSTRYPASLAKFNAAFIRPAVNPYTYYQTQKDFTEAYLLASEVQNMVKRNVDTVRLLPEHREEILSGTLLNTNNQPISNTFITFSIPENPFQLRAAETDQTGTFFIPFQSTTKEVTGYVIPLDLDSGFTIKLENEFLNKFPDFDYSLTPLDSNQIREIMAISIRNQIENAFYQEKAHNITDSIQLLPQVSYDYLYVLDEYTRFPSLKETFTEFIPYTSVRENRTPIIKPHIETLANQQNAPLILLDGLPVSAHEILKFSPYKIESIGILNNRYFLGPLVADGVVNFQTKPGNFEKFNLNGNFLKINILGISGKKNYEFPEYSAKIHSTLPDQRDQLFWDPDLKVTSDEPTEIQFFTSDVTGKFEVVIEGFTWEGDPITIVRTIAVINDESQ